jgi:HTH domain
MLKRFERLFCLLQSPRDWTGSELAERLQVSTRTVRIDVGWLRNLVSGARDPRVSWRLPARRWCVAAASAAR